jgi:hypothetical protein
MHLVQLLLPTRDRAGTPFPTTAAAQTRVELVEQFGGVTAYLRSAAAGAWVNDDGVLERDEVVMVEVLVESFDQHWWREYARRLAERFGQEEMHIRAMQVTVITTRT